MRPHLQAPSMPHPVSSPSQISHILGSNPVSLTDLLPLPSPQPKPARSSLGPVPSLPALSGHPCLKHKLQSFCHDPVYLPSKPTGPSILHSAFPPRQIYPQTPGLEREVPPVHQPCVFSTFPPNHVQTLGPTYPHNLSSAPTCSVYTRSRTINRCLHAQVLLKTLQK